MSDGYKLFRSMFFDRINKIIQDIFIASREASGLWYLSLAEHAEITEFFFVQSRGQKIENRESRVVKSINGAIGT